MRLERAQWEKLLAISLGPGHRVPRNDVTAARHGAGVPELVPRDRYDRGKSASGISYLTERRASC